MSESHQCWDPVLQWCVSQAERSEIEPVASPVANQTSVVHVSAGCLRVVSTERRAVSWVKSGFEEHLSCGVVRGEDLWIPDNGDAMLRLRLRDGQLLGRHRVGRGAFLVPPCVVDEWIIASSYSGELAAFRLGDCRSWRVDLDEPCWAAPAVSQAVYQVTLEGTVFSLERPTGRVSWVRKLRREVRATPAICSRLGLLIVAGTDGLIEALSTRTGETVWQLCTSRCLDSELLVLHDRMYVGPGSLLEISLTGKVLGEVHLEGYVEAPKDPNTITYSDFFRPSIKLSARDATVFALCGERLYWFASGARSADRYLDLGSRRSLTPFMGVDHIFVADRDGSLTAFGMVESPEEIAPQSSPP